MDKVQFYRMYGCHYHFDSHIFDYWYDWCEKRGIDRDVIFNRYSEDHWTFDIDYETGEMRIKHKDGEDRIPLEYFWENKEYPDIKMLWHSGYWDGPLSGMCLYNGKKYWFDCEVMEHDDNNDAGIRKYGLYELSDEEVDYEEWWHNLWRFLVGHHCDYGDKYGPYKGQLTTSVFYTLQKLRKKPRDYTKNVKIGVFDECLFDRSKKKDIDC